MIMAERQVELYVYDLSQGIPQLTSIFFPRLHSIRFGQTGEINQHQLF
jgi:hypothetical protein